jgi:hypothetical protein
MSPRLNMLAKTKVRPVSPQQKNTQNFKTNDISETLKEERFSGLLQPLFCFSRVSIMTCREGTAYIRRRESKWCEVRIGLGWGTCGVMVKGWGGDYLGSKENGSPRAPVQLE